MQTGYIWAPYTTKIVSYVVNGVRMTPEEYHSGIWPIELKELFGSFKEKYASSSIDMNNYTTLTVD